MLLWLWLVRMTGLLVREGQKLGVPSCVRTARKIWLLASVDILNTNPRGIDTAGNYRRPEAYKKKKSKGFYINA